MIQDLLKVFSDLTFSHYCQRWSVVPGGGGGSAVTVLSGFSVQLDRSTRPPSSGLDKEVKAGNDDVDALNKTLFLPSLNTNGREGSDDIPVTWKGRYVTSGSFERVRGQKDSVFSFTTIRKETVLGP